MSRRRRAGAALVAALALLPGCAVVPGLGGEGTRLEIVSQTLRPRRLASRLETGCYAHDPDRGTRVIASDRSEAELVSGDFDRGQVLHLELLWVPRAGATPMDPTATNASVRYVLFVDGEIGVYGGAGFVVPDDEPGADRLGLDVRNVTLSLLESTPGFADLLTPAELSGAIHVELDETRTRRLYFNVSQKVTNTLGRSRFVRGHPPATLSRPTRTVARVAAVTR